MAKSNGIFLLDLLHSPPHPNQRTSTFAARLFSPIFIGCDATDATDMQHAVEFYEPQSTTLDGKMNQNAEYL